VLKSPLCVRACVHACMHAKKYYRLPAAEPAFDGACQLDQSTQDTASTPWEQRRRRHPRRSNFAPETWSAKKVRIRERLCCCKLQLLSTTYLARLRPAPSAMSKAAVPEPRLGKSPVTTAASAARACPASAVANELRCVSQTSSGLFSSTLKMDTNAASPQS